MNVTMIGDLPEAAEVDNYGGGGYNQYEQMPGKPATESRLGVDSMVGDKYQKAIRGNHQLSPNSGMMPMNSYDPSRGNHYEDMPPHPHPHAQQPPPQALYHPQLHCIDVAKHVQDCPICSRFYNNDKTAYVIAIIVLLVICLLLLKRILNV